MDLSQVPIPAPAIPRIVEDLMAPAVFANEALSFRLDGGTITITVSANRAIHAGGQDGALAFGAEPARVVVGRVTMPIAGAERLAVGLFDFLRGHGLIEELPAQ